MKPEVNIIEIGKITTGGQPCSDPPKNIRHNPAPDIRSKGAKLYQANSVPNPVNAYRP